MSKNDSMGLPDWYVDLVDWVQEFRMSNPTAFEIAFVFGFISGISGSGSAANSRRNKNNN